VGEEEEDELTVHHTASTGDAEVWPIVLFYFIWVIFHVWNICDGESSLAH
jgi:hypothetical protein